MLTPKQRRFIDEYLLDCNATQAAIRAGYSPHTAKAQAAMMLQKEEIKQAIATRMEEISTAKTADIQEILEYLTAVMRGETVEPALILVGNGVQEVIQKAPDTKDRIRAAELIGKRYGMFSDRLKLGGTIPIVIRDDIPDDDG